VEQVASRAINSWLSLCLLLSRWYFFRPIRPWKWKRYIPPKGRLTFNGLHGVISQKTVLFHILVSSYYSTLIDLLSLSPHQSNYPSKLQVITYLEEQTTIFMRSVALSVTQCLFHSVSLPLFPPLPLPIDSPLTPRRILPQLHRVCSATRPSVPKQRLC
jgi:hypothetical protein